MAKNRTNLFFSGVLILTVANILVKVIGFLYKIPLQNLIGDEGMGYFNAAYRIYTMFYMVSTAGLPVAVSLMISESRARGNRREVKEIFKAAVILFVVIGTLGTSFMFFGSKILAKVIGMKASYLCIMAISPTLLFICICSAVRGYFQGYQNMLPTAVSEVLEALGKLILGMLLGTFAIKQGYSLPVVAAYAILGLTIGVFAGSFYIVMHRTFFKSEEFDAEFVEDENAIVRSKATIMKTLFKIAIPITISASVMSVADAIDVVVISRQLQNLGFTEEVAAQYYGNYTTLCVPMFNLPPVLIYPISYSIVPYISSALAERDTKRAKDVMTSSLKIAALIAIPSALGLSAMSKPILSLIFKNEASVEMAAPLLSVLALSVFFLGILSVSNALLQATKNEKLPIIS
ncbi:MAG: polysaccharide biosynthesis protein, partial [Clostridia bacterium]|nr:polysaccharide biosynthesis protein [Clostridia bacterium]